MFAVIYRAYLKAGTELEYQHFWNLVANYFIKHCGALGSCLHQTEEGFWLAYSRGQIKQREMLHGQAKKLLPLYCPMKLKKPF